MRNATRRAVLPAFSPTVSIYCLVIITFHTICYGRIERGIVLGLLVTISLGVDRMYSLLNPFPIKRYVRHPFSSFLFYTLFKMAAVIEIEFLQGNNEQVIKEVGIRADGGARLHYLFRPPYHMEPHGSKESGLNWDDGFVHHSQIQTVLTEALAPFNHLYSRGEDKCLLLHDILGRTIEDLESLQCPKPTELKSDIQCHLPCHSFPNMSCALRNADGQYSWLQYHTLHKTFIKCPPNNTRHTAQFSSGVPKPNTVM